MGRSRPPPDDRCLPPEDLTAFSAGELSEARRAQVSRHLLRCPSCRAVRAETTGVLGALRAFGTTPGWTGDLAGARAAVQGERRARRRATVTGLAAAALLATGLALAPRLASRDAEGLPAAAPVAGRVAPGGADGAADPASEAALLRAQLPDGRWSSAAGGEDEAATGLALLALLADRHEALRSGPVAQAVAGAVRWLRSRQGEDGGFGGHDPSRARGHALATEALLEVWAATRDSGLRGMLLPAVRRLEEEARGAPQGAWTRHALARAADLGWPAPARAAAVASEAARAAALPPTWTLPGTGDRSSCARVLAVLSR